MAFRQVTLLTSAGVLAALLSTRVQAMDWRPDAVEALGGPAPQGTGQLAAGAIWDWGVLKQPHSPITGQTELIASYWTARSVGGGSQALGQLALVPVLRLQPDSGHSPFAMELGIGLSWMAPKYTTPDKHFSTTWNFYDVLGASYRFGDDEEQEIGVRYVHLSNAGLRHPNPGEDFLLLRYAHRL